MFLKIKRPQSPGSPEPRANVKHIMVHDSIGIQIILTPCVNRGIVVKTSASAGDNSHVFIMHAFKIIWTEEWRQCETQGITLTSSLYWECCSLPSISVRIQTFRHLCLYLKSSPLIGRWNRFQENSFTEFSLMLSFMVLIKKYELPHRWEPLLI